MSKYERIAVVGCGAFGSMIALCLSENGYELTVFEREAECFRGASFNNQNTSTNRETSRVYFTPSCAGRNSDIWTSYIMFKLTEQKNEIIGFGAPYVKQIRNEHNLWTDLNDEFQNNKLTEYFVSLLKKVDIDISTYPVMLENLIKNSQMILTYLKV